MRQTVALLAAAALGFVLGALWQGESALRRAERVGDPAPVVGTVETNARAHDTDAPPAEGPPLRAGEEEEDDEGPQSSTCGVVVDVVGVDGAPPARARVKIDARSHLWTPQDRFVAALPGFHLVDARNEADGARSEQVLIAVRPNEPASVTLRLRPRPSLRVLVVLPAGIAEADVHLYMRPFRGRNIPPLVHPRKLTGQGRYERSWLDLAPGRYLVAAQYRRAPNIDVRQEVVVDGDAPTTVTLQLPPPDPACIPVNVLGPDGAPIADVQARTGWHDPANGNVLTKRAVARQDDGTVLLPPVPDNVPADWPRLLEVRAPELGYVLREFPRDGTVRLREPGWIEVRLAGGEGAHVVTKLTYTGPDGAFQLDSRLGRATDGRQGFGPLQPGRYDVVARVTYPHLNPGKFAAVQTKADVVSGSTTRVTLRLPELR